MNKPRESTTSKTIKIKGGKVIIAVQKRAIIIPSPDPARHYSAKPAWVPPPPMTPLADDVHDRLAGRSKFPIDFYGDGK